MVKLEGRDAPYIKPWNEKSHMLLCFYGAEILKLSQHMRYDTWYR